MNNVLEQLSQVLEARKAADPDNSYVASLHARGLNKILEEVGEECTETLIAAKDAEQSGKTDDLIYEAADLCFHILVMLSRFDPGVTDILAKPTLPIHLSALAAEAIREQF